MGVWGGRVQMTPYVDVVRLAGGHIQNPYPLQTRME